MTTIINPVRRVLQCDACHRAECERCGATTLCHTNSLYFGGSGYRLVTACTNERACEQRRGGR